VLLLRFRTTSPTKLSRKFNTYWKIARIVKLDYSSVQHICRLALEEKKPPRAKNPERKLEQEHVEYLTSEVTLRL